MQKSKTFDTEAQAEDHETPLRAAAEETKKRKRDALTPEMQRAIHLKRSGGNHATEARASEKIQELLLACDEEGFEVRMRGARLERADMLMRFKDTAPGKFFEIQVKSCTQRNAGGMARFGQVNHYTCPVLCWLHATAEDPPSLWMFRGEELQRYAANLTIGKSPQKKMFRNARVDLTPSTLEERGKTVYKALRNVIEQAPRYTPLTLDEHARNMAGNNYVNYHARKEFAQLESQEGVSRTECELEGEPYSHTEGEARVRESVASPQANSAGFQVKLNKNSGMTSGGKYTYTALEAGDFDTLRVFLLARPPRTSSSTDASACSSSSASSGAATSASSLSSSSSSSSSSWEFTRTPDATNTEIDSYQLVGYWEFSAEELQRKNVLGKKQTLTVYPSDDFCGATGWRPPQRVSANTWTRECDFFHSLVRSSQRRLDWPAR